MKAVVAQLTMVSVPCDCTHPGPGHKFSCPKMRMLRALAHLEKAEGSSGASMTDRMVKYGSPEYGTWTWDKGRWRVKFE